MFWHLSNLFIRITPALAGTTDAKKIPKINTGDHPRACGDYLAKSATLAISAGSPPRLRGLLISLNSFLVISRITPALAGTTRRFFRERQKLRDHPRACGDYCLTLCLYPNLQGSPPRLRGLRTRGHLHRLSTGITPALAGTTTDAGGRSQYYEDHPRACGDYDRAISVRLLG